ncbi:hypothetical protein MNV49_003709 [Pseudohyphozyma bogoriensis]|nr:hypothetical protein MNV49_003709 [Pseudohyphozyma bogoriensis]
MFRATLRRCSQHAVHGSPLPTPVARTKLTTGLTGLAVHPNPFPELLKVYSNTLTLVQQIPASAVYRQAVESITTERKAAVELLGGKGSEEDIAAVEEKIGAGVIEEVLVMAEDEYNLATKMIEWKAWEDLESPPAAGQWKPFKGTPSTTVAEDLAV